jgi:hypothetical protein
MRTTVASRKIAAASPIPNSFRKTSGEATKARKTPKHPSRARQPWGEDSPRRV